jgi:hypothetical protein
MTPGVYLPWPFFDNPPLTDFRPEWLVFDAIVGLIVIWLAVPSVAAWLLERKQWLQMLMFAVIISILLLWTAALSFAAVAPLGWNMPNAVLIWLLPQLIVVVAAFWSFAVLARSALVPKWLAENRLVPLLVHGTLVVFFLSYIVGDAAGFYSPIKGVTLGFLAATAVLGGLCVAKRVARSNGNRLGTKQEQRKSTVLQRFDGHSTSLLGLATSSWLAMVIVGWTTLYFGLFDRTSFYDVGRENGVPGWITLDAYGWPWMYAAHYDGSAESRAWAAEEGFVIDVFKWPSLIADVFVAIFAIAGTGFTVHRFVRGSWSWLRFGSRTLLAAVFGTSLFLWLPHAGDYHILWPNWFAQLVLYFGIGCGAYGVSTALIAITDRLFRHSDVDIAA